MLLNVLKNPGDTMAVSQRCSWKNSWRSGREDKNIRVDLSGEEGDQDVEKMEEAELQVDGRRHHGFLFGLDARGHVGDEEPQDENNAGVNDAATSDGLLTACKLEEFRFKAVQNGDDRLRAGCSSDEASNEEHDCKYDTNTDQSTENSSRRTDDFIANIQNQNKTGADNDIDERKESINDCLVTLISTDGGEEEHFGTISSENEVLSAQVCADESQGTETITEAGSSNKYGNNNKTSASIKVSTPPAESFISDRGNNDVCQDSDEEDLKDAPKIYSDPGFSSSLFHTLENMRQNSVLTDLTLITEDGHQCQVHSTIMSALSGYIQTKLRMKPRNERMFSLHLPPAVRGPGLAAVIEFGYTGSIRNLNGESLMTIISAAVSLDALGVLDLCDQRREKEPKMKREKRQNVVEENMLFCLQQVKKLREERVGCDVEIDIEGRLFHAHRVVLAASSDYFRGMFTSGMRETQQERVSLFSVDSSIFQSLLQHSYSGSVALGWGSVFELACTSLQFQFQSAFSQCISFLGAEMTPHSCLDVGSFAEAYGMMDLLASANDFVLRHFEDVSKTPKYQDLPIDKLKKFLKSESLCVPSELTVFQAVMTWVEAFPKQRVKFARDLMGAVHFNLLTDMEFIEVKTITSRRCNSARRHYESLLREFCSRSSDGQSSFRSYLPEHSLVLVGGERFTENLDKRVPSREMWFSNSLQNHVGLVKKVEWRMLGMLPEKPRFSHRVVVMRGKLYLAGGRHYYGKDDTMRCTFRYDPVLNSWQRLADMNENRGSFSLVALTGKIYAIGGERDSESNMESIEVYCPTKNSWSFVHPLDSSLCGHAATVWNDAIFISGGLNAQYHCQLSMILYHPEHGSTYLAEMRSGRAMHCMETLGERFYVAGGVTTNAEGNLEDHLPCEVYDPRADSWSAFMPFSVPHVGAASEVLEGKLYVIGGYRHDDFSDTRTVHRYDPGTERWEKMGATPGPNTCISACVLPVPDHLRQKGCSQLGLGAAAV